MGKFPFQLEVPSKYKDKLPQSENLSIKSKTSSVIRLYSPTLENLIKQYKHIESEISEIRENLLIRQLGRFTENSKKWNAAITWTAYADCLVGLSKICQNASGPICRPKILETDSPLLDIKQMVHPTVANQ